MVRQLIYRAYENPEHSIHLINQFMPLIKKQSRRLSYPEAESDLIISLLVFLPKLKFYADLNLTVGQLNSCVVTFLLNTSKDLNRKHNEKKFFIQSELFDDQGENDFYAVEIIDLLSRLSQQEAFVLTRRYFYCESIKQIGEKLNITRQAVYKIHDRAITSLQKMLGES